MIQVIFCYGYHLPSICIRNTALLFLVLQNTGLFVSCTSICAICEIQTGVSNDETYFCIVTSYFSYPKIKIFYGIGLLQSNLWWRLKIKNAKYLSTENAQIYVHDMHQHLQPNLFLGLLTGQGADIYHQWYYWHTEIYFEQKFKQVNMWLFLLQTLPEYIYQSHCLNWLWLGDAIWHKRSC